MDYQFSNNIVLRILSIVLFLTFFQQIKAQRSDDVGVFLGGSYYMGDINPDKLFYNPTLGYGVILRHNYNPMVSMSYAAMRGKLQASDADFASNGFQHYRGATLTDDQLIEASAQVEYNLYPVTGDKPKTERFSPYIKIGLAIVYGAKFSPKLQMVVPFALGLKYKLSRKLEISTEWSFRRTFSDKLDNIQQYYIEGLFANRQRSFSKTRDWYSFFGINLHYCLKRTNLKCPAYSNFQ